MCFLIFHCHVSPSSPHKGFWLSLESALSWVGLSTDADPCIHTLRSFSVSSIIFPCCFNVIVGIFSTRLHMFHDLGLVLWHCANCWTICVIRTNDFYHLFVLLHCLNYFHFCCQHYHLVLFSGTSYITAAFTFVSGHPGFKIKIPYYYSLYRTVW